MPRVGENLSKEQRDKGLKRLTQRQQDFLDNFVHKDMTQTASAREAAAAPGARHGRMFY